MSEIAAALSRLAKTLDERAAQFEHVVTARVYLKEYGLVMEAKAHDSIDHVRTWFMHVTWEYMTDDPERAVDFMLQNFEQRVSSVLRREEAANG